MVILKQVQAIAISAALTASGFAAQVPAGTTTTQALPTGASTATAEELKQLAAPIALYPDALVGQVLAGATYPTQVVEADQWLQKNSSLKGEQLASAVDKQPWDPSIKGLTQFPSVLQNMNKNLAWTSTLGEAYINDPQAVMKAIQELRVEAKSAGNLKSTSEQTVTTEGQTIVIQPANPEVVYVPQYSPATVYGAPIESYPGYSGWETAAASAVSFGVGTLVGAAFGGGGWGWGFNHWGANWGGGTVNFNRNAFVSRSNTFANRNAVANRANIANRNVANRNMANRNMANRNMANRNMAANRNFANRPANRAAGGANRSAALNQARSFSGNRQRLNSSASRGFGQAGARGARSNAFSGGRQGGSARLDSRRGASSFSGRSRGGSRGGGGRSRGGGGGRSRGGGGRGGRGGGRR